MSAPNMLSPTTITGKLALVHANTTGFFSIIANPAASGKVMKVNCLYIANTSSGNDYTFDVKIVRSSNPYYLAGVVTVAKATTVIAVDKDSSIYLEEGDEIFASCTGSTHAYFTASYEEIS